jgi:hypothetical protein
MLIAVRRASIQYLRAVPDPTLEETPSRRGRRSHGWLSFDANHLALLRLVWAASRIPLVYDEGSLCYVWYG